MSQEAEGDYTRLRELLLIEEFKNCLPNEVKTYLDENKVETIQLPCWLTMTLSPKDFC